MSTGDMVKLNYSVNIEDFAKAGDISSNTKKVLKKLGIPSDITRRAAIVTYEAEMNIIIHSSGGEIIVNIDTAKIEIIARDYGPGIPDIDRAMQKGIRPCEGVGFWCRDGAAQYETVQRWFLDRIPKRQRHYRNQYNTHS